MPLVWPLMAPLPSMLIVPVVDVALMPLPPVEVRLTLLVIVVVPVVADSIDHIAADIADSAAGERNDHVAAALSSSGYGAGSCR